VALPVKCLRPDTRTADKSKNRVEARSDAERAVLSEIAALKRFKKLMKKHEGKLSFSGLDKT